MTSPKTRKQKERREPPPGWGARVKEEVEQVGLVTLYFLVCFGVILTLKKLFLADHQIEFYALSVTLISALIAGKVVIVLGKTSVGTRFDANHPLAIAVLYKTALYCAVAFLCIFAEKLFHGYRATGSLGDTAMSIWAHRDRDDILAKLICVALAFVGFHFYAALDRRLGEGTLRRMLWSRK